jgi:sucrose phosphorylase
MKVISDRKLKSIRTRLRRLYGERTPLLLHRLEMVIGRYGVGLDAHKPDSLWNQQDVVLIAYADSVQRAGETPLHALHRLLTKRLKGAISAVHVLPFYPWSSDDGFSVIDYREVRPEYGTWKDIDALGRDFKLMFDLVLNHCSAKSGWFRDFVSSIAPARHYFHEMDPATDLSAVVRPRPWPLLTETSTRDGKRHVWTTFSADQVDLNFGNPDVLFEFIDILLLYISHGAKLIRLDAVAFLWKKVGTNCIHLPETHEVVKLLRDLLDSVAPEVILLTETNVPHQENISYFGRGDEAHMVYQFSLPPLLLHGLLNQTASHLTRWAASLRDLPKGCTYFNFTASHDGIGVRPLEGILDDAELAGLVRAVEERGGRVSARSQPDGSLRPYELNITYVDALSDPSTPELGEERFLCSQAVALAMRGIPGIYFNSLVGTRNDERGFAETGQNRTLNRRKWDLDALKMEIDNPKSPHARIFTRFIRMLRRRNAHPAFHPDGPQRVFDVGPGFFAFSRTAPDGSETVTCLYSFKGEKQTLDAAALPSMGGASDFLDILTGRTVSTVGGKPLAFKPYQALWLVAK